MMGESNEMENRNELWSLQSTLQMKRKQCKYVTAFLLISTRGLHSKEGCADERPLGVLNRILYSYNKMLKGRSLMRLSSYGIETKLSALGT